MAITYDPRKRASNLEKHGVDFEDAGEVFAGFGLTEARYVTIGRLRGREVVVVWTQRGDDQRIISMRPADEKERAYFRQRLSEAGRDDG